MKPYFWRTGRTVGVVPQIRLGATLQPTDLETFQRMAVVVGFSSFWLLATASMHPCLAFAWGFVVLGEGCWTNSAKADTRSKLVSSSPGLLVWAGAAFTSSFSYG